MRLLIQRVKKASVTADGEDQGSIQKGLVVFLAIHKEDQPDDTKWFVNKLLHLRIFEDDQGKMNLSAQDVQGELLIVSQFTLYGNCRNGRRPDFFDSASGPEAESIYQKFVEETHQLHPYKIVTGKFAAHMEVDLINNGPVTLVVDK